MSIFRQITTNFFGKKSKTIGGIKKALVLRNQPKPFSYARKFAKAMQTGMVRMARILVKPQTLEATPVFRPYLAENITVLLAVGAAAKTAEVTSRAPRTPKSQRMPMVERGITSSFKSATQ